MDYVSLRVIEGQKEVRMMRDQEFILNLEKVPLLEFLS
jgi:hypothetical protein